MGGSEPGVGSFTVTPSDTTVYSPPLRSVYVETAGNIHFQGADGNDDTWPVDAKTTVPVMIQRVYLTGTTATGIHGIR